MTARWGIAFVGREQPYSRRYGCASEGGCRSACSQKRSILRQRDLRAGSPMTTTATKKKKQASLASFFSAKGNASEQCAEGDTATDDSAKAVSINAGDRSEPDATVEEPAPKRAKLQGAPADHPEQTSSAKGQKLRRRVIESDDDDGGDARAEADNLQTAERTDSEIDDEGSAGVASDGDEVVESEDDSPVEPSTTKRKSTVSSKKELSASSVPVRVSKYDPIADADWPAGKDLPYIHLARLFNKLENESSRLAKIDLVTNFLRSVIVKTPDALTAVIYLCVNKLGPDYEGLEIGVGDGLLVKVLASSTGRSAKVIQQDLRESGDLGLIAERCRSTQRTIFPPPPLTVMKLLATFRRIASEKPDKKMGSIKQLLVSSRECEARYITRSFQGNLRIGCSLRTVLPSLARACTVTPPLTPEERSEPLNSLEETRLDRSLHWSDTKLSTAIQTATSIVNRVWVEVPNLDKIVSAILAYGVEHLREHCYLTPGIPIKSMLAAPSKSISEVLSNFEGHEFVLEYKYDGERAQIHYLDDGSVQIFSRNAECTTNKYPDLVSMLPRAFKTDVVKSCILDSEVVAFDRLTRKIRPFQILSTRKRKDVTEESIKVDVCVFVFDIIYLNGESLLDYPLVERRSKMRECLAEIDDQLRFVIEKRTSDEADIQTFLDEAVADNCEGLMVKCLDGDAALSHYEPDKRSHAWRKLKKDYLEGLTDSFDLVPIGAYHGKGKRTGSYGGYLLAVYDADSEEFQSVCKIGTGFSDEVLQKLTADMEPHILEVPRSYYRYSDKDVPDVWLDGHQVWEVRAADISISPAHKAAVGIVHDSKGVALRFPRFVQVRPDKRPEDATTSEQIAELYNNQVNRQ
ncbi:DNA ligase [Plasmodiophora brassicae]